MNIFLLIFFVIILFIVALALLIFTGKYFLSFVLMPYGPIFVASSDNRLSVMLELAEAKKERKFLT